MYLLNNFSSISLNISMPAISGNRCINMHLTVKDFFNVRARAIRSRFLSIWMKIGRSLSHGVLTVAYHSPINIYSCHEHHCRALHSRWSKALSKQSKHCSKSSRDVIHFITYHCTSLQFSPLKWYLGERGRKCSERW